IRNLRRFAGSCRFVYNKALALNVERYEQKKKRLGYAGLCALLPNWKMEHEFLSAVPAQALQQALKNLERAYTNFFQKRADFPKFNFVSLKASRWTSKTDASNCRNLVGCATASLKTCSAKPATSPSANGVVRGSSQSKQRERSRRPSTQRYQQSGWTGV